MLLAMSLFFLGEGAPGFQIVLRRVERLLLLLLL